MTENQTVRHRPDQAAQIQPDQTMQPQPDQAAQLQRGQAGQLPEENVQGRGDGRLGIMVQVGLLAGPFMSMIDSSVVNVALPDMAAGMHSSLSAVQWVASAYLLALGMALTGTAFLARRFGTKRVYLASLIGFTAASALCAICLGLWTLIAARVAQGIFGAPLVPLAMNMLMGKGAGKQISAAAGMILFLAPAVGPSLGGVLIDWAGWPMIFLINIPVGILAVIGSKRLPGALTGKKDDAAHFDAPGFGLLAGGMAGITFGASQGTQAGWLSLSAWPYWTVGAVLLASYAVWAGRREHPIVDLSLWRPRQALALALTALVSVVTFAVIVLVPAFMQEIQGQSAVAAGMALLPQGVVTGVGTVLGNRLPTRWGVRRTAVSGMALLTLSTAGLLAVTATSPAWLVAADLPSGWSSSPS
ncbi:MAG: MFS transporter [Bacilli bacterium]